MERKKNILCALMLMFAASASFTCANAHEIELREVNPNDTIWTEEDVHPKRKSPGIRIPIPTVEYIPEQGVILFESSTDQSVCYCIAEGDDMDNPIASGELELMQGEDVQICWQGGDYPNGYNLYIWVNGHSYVGKIE